MPRFSVGKAASFKEPSPSPNCTYNLDFLLRVLEAVSAACTDTSPRQPVFGFWVPLTVWQAGNTGCDAFQTQPGIDVSY